MSGQTGILPSLSAYKGKLLNEKESKKQELYNIVSDIWKLEYKIAEAGGEKILKEKPYLHEYLGLFYMKATSISENLGNQELTKKLARNAGIHLKKAGYQKHAELYKSKYN